MEHRCFYCGEDEHLISQCPLHAKISATISRSTCYGSLMITPNQCPTTHAFTMPIITEHSDTPLVCTALIDSGALGSFIDAETIHQLGLPMVPLLHPIKSQAIDEGGAHHSPYHHVVASMDGATWPTAILVRKVTYPLVSLLPPSLSPQTGTGSGLHFYWESRDTALCSPTSWISGPHGGSHQGKAQWPLPTLTL